LGGVEEIFLLNQLIRWATHQASKGAPTASKTSEPSGEELRGLLGDLLNTIRFPTMPLSDIAGVIAPMNILTSDQMLGLFTWISAPKGSHGDDEKCGSFNSKPRTPPVLPPPPAPPESLCSRGGVISPSVGWGYGGSADAITIRPSRRVELLGVGVFLPTGASTTTITVSTTTGASVGTATQTWSRTTANNQPERLAFATPLVLDPTQTYDVVLSQTGGSTHYITSGAITSIPSGSGEAMVTFTVGSSSRSANGTGTTNGQVPCWWWRIPLDPSAAPSRSSSSRRK